MHCALSARTVLAAFRLALPSLYSLCSRRCGVRRAGVGGAGHATRRYGTRQGPPRACRPGREGCAEARHSEGSTRVPPKAHTSGCSSLPHLWSRFPPPGCGPSVTGLLITPRDVEQRKLQLAELAELFRDSLETRAATLSGRGITGYIFLGRPRRHVR